MLPLDFWFNSYPAIGAYLRQQKTQNQPMIDVPTPLQFSWLGEVAMDILANYWSPPIQLRTVLWSVRVLLGDPNLDDFCFKNAYKTDIKTVIITQCIFYCMYGNCYLWLWKQENFKMLPLDLWFNCASYILPETTSGSMEELALEANIPNQALRIACTAEEIRNGILWAVA